MNNPVFAYLPLDRCKIYKSFIFCGSEILEYSTIKFLYLSKFDNKLHKLDLLLHLVDFSYTFPSGLLASRGGIV